MVRTEVIAEIGWSWIGDFQIAHDMIAAAAEAGADYIKTQTWREDKLRSGPWDNDGRRDLYKKSQLHTMERQLRFVEMCQKYRIKYLTSVFDVADLELIPPMHAIKIPGIESDNDDLFDACCARFSKIFTSLAGRSDSDLLLAMQSAAYSTSHVILMHGVYLYPCPLEYSNLWRIKWMQGHYSHIGYSDHTEGAEAAIAAIGMGVEVVEKHFTIDNNLEGRDNKFSCLPETLRQICDFRDKMAIMSQIKNPDDSSIRAYKGRWAG